MVKKPPMPEDRNVYRKKAVAVYVREDVQVAGQWLDIAATQDIATIQVANLPVDSMELGLQHWYANKDAVVPDELAQ